MDENTGRKTWEHIQEQVNHIVPVPDLMTRVNKEDVAAAKGAKPIRVLHTFNALREDLVAKPGDLDSRLRINGYEARWERPIDDRLPAHSCGVPAAYLDNEPRLNSANNGVENLNIRLSEIAIVKGEADI